jgi:DUF4097 and DUF4098 domain-containing protein YvlB
MLLLPWAGHAMAGPVRLEKRIETSDRPQIRIHNQSGQIVIRAWDKAEVHVTWTTSVSSLQLGVEQIPSNGRADRVRFTTEGFDGLMKAQQGAAELTVEAPVSASVEVHNPQGSVLVKGLRGGVSVETVDGSISIIEAAAEHLSVRSIGGDIVVIRTSGRVEATSISGKLHLIFPASSHITANTTSGDITYEGDLVPSGEYKLSTYGGNIEVLCPRSASFELRARTIHGKVVADPAFGLKKGHSAALFSELGNSFIATSRTGSSTLDLRSYNGTIHIRGQK